VFTFTTGYNFVWSSWLAGIQSDVSLNRNNIRMRGGNQSVTSSTSINTFTSVSSASNIVSSNLENKWTISEMVRLGYLVTPDLLVYGLVGWSWADFEWNPGFTVTPFTMNGFTWGAGVEKDFGWLRAFLQYKGISYRNKDVDFSAPSSSQTTSSVFAFSTNTADSIVRRFSGDVQQVTAGITIPLDFR
jgi:opacity protein-like surface antigen